MQRALTKTVAVMNLIGIFLLAGAMQVAAAGMGQTVTYSGKSVPLQQVFTSIKKQTGFVFFYDKDVLDEKKKVTVHFDNEELSSALTKILADEPLEFEIQGNTIFITGKKPAVIKPKLELDVPPPPVTGVVKGPDGQPLAGVNIVVKGTKRGTTTNADGSFAIEAAENDVLVISSVGYLSKELLIRNNATAGVVSLVLAEGKLDEIQIIAYGKTSQRYSTSSNYFVTSTEIEKQPVNNPLLALQGRVPGLLISSTNGLPGSSVKVIIQGLNSFRPEGQAPFYVVDGVPYSQNFTGASLNMNAVSNGGQGGSTLNFINPADIASISILKDADATAIYGSRAANGAILITTKKGKPGKVKGDVNLQQGWGNLAHKYKYLNTQQYLEMRKEAYSNASLPVPDGNATPSQDNFDLTVWDQNRYTDWQRELVGGTAHYTNFGASISGGSANTQFLFGYGYNRQTTVYPNSLADQKANVHFNINHTSPDGKLNVMLNGSYLYDRNRLNGSDLMGEAIKLSPNAPALYNDDGSLNWEPLPNNSSVYSFANPMAAALQPYTGITGNLTANNSISYQIIPGLELKTTMGYNKLQGEENILKPMASIKPDAPFRIRSASFLSKSISSWIIEPQATYTKNTTWGNFDVLVGGTLQQSNTNVLQQTGSNYANDAQLGSLLGAPTVTIDGVVKNIYKYNAVFGRLNYRLRDKYIINLTARRDGSSRFGDANKFHTFYAIAGAWLFAEEGLIKSNLPWLSTGKIRANYGTTGNDQINDYAYQSLLENYRVDLAYLGVTGIYPTNIANPYLQWEETRKLNLGIDLGFFNNRLDISANYFRNRSSNQLLTPLLPFVTGFQSITQNLPATIQNTGLELMLSVTPIRNKDLIWRASINFTCPKNELIEYPELSNSTNSNFYIIGEPINIIRKFRFAGVNKETGYYEFYTFKGEKTYDPDYSSDLIALYDPNPKYYGGISNSISVKGFQLDFLFQAVKQKGENYRLGNLPGFNLNQPISVLDRWQQTGQIASIQKYSSGFQDFNAFIRFFTAAYSSDATYADASYIRLKNLSLSYTIAEKWLQKTSISSARIFVQGQNLLTMTKFKGTDPETMTASVLPPLRIVTLGAQISF